MALQDILDAIVAEANRRIDEARSAHNRQQSDRKEQHRQAVSDLRQSLDQSKDEKMTQLKAKAESHAQNLVQNGTLREKQSILDDLYAETLSYLSSQSDNDLEPLVRGCLERITGEGTIRPAKKHVSLVEKLAKGKTIGEPLDCMGGFVFESSKSDEDYTFETLVHQYLRPQTELHVSSQLFA